MFVMLAFLKPFLTFLAIAFSQFLVITLAQLALEHLGPFSLFLFAYSIGDYMGSSSIFNFLSLSFPCF
jgi:hypothetical protein